MVVFVCTDHVTSQFVTLPDTRSLGESPRLNMDSLYTSVSVFPRCIQYQPYRTVWSRDKPSVGLQCLIHLFSSFLFVLYCLLTRASTANSTRATFELSRVLLLAAYICFDFLLPTNSHTRLYLIVWRTHNRNFRRLYEAAYRLDALLISIPLHSLHL